MLPQLLTTDTIDLGGNALRIIRIWRADTVESTILYLPSLATGKSRTATIRRSLGNRGNICGISPDIEQPLSMVSDTGSCTGVLGGILSRLPLKTR
jgi:hypothetical protein